jgi:hypothetical protein
MRDEHMLDLHCRCCEFLDKSPALCRRLLVHGNCRFVRRNGLRGCTIQASEPAAKLSTAPPPLPHASQQLHNTCLPGMLGQSRIQAGCLRPAWEWCNSFDLQVRAGCEKWELLASSTQRATSATSIPYALYLD